MSSPLLPSSPASIPPSSSAPQRPSSLAPLPRLWGSWKSFARSMGEFQSRILLGIFYFLVVAPFGLGVRALGDPLGLHRLVRPSNWILRKETSPDNLDEAKKQF